MKTIGIDVSKSKLDVLWLREVVTEKVKTKVLSNTGPGHIQLIHWLEKSTGGPIGDCHCVMEATGIYHEELAYALHEAGAKVSVVNPAYVRDHGKSRGVRTKTDRRDSFVLAHYGATQSVGYWEPEPEAVRVLKSLIARVQALEKDCRREQARLEHTPRSGTHDRVVESIHAVIDQLDAEITRLRRLIDDHIDQNPTLKKDDELLRTIPGVGEVVSRVMLSVLHSKRFVDARQCAASLGLNPIEYESGTSIRRPPRLSKAGGARVREKLYMAAVVCTQHNPDIKRFYQRLLRNGKSKKSAVCAAMRKLVHICFGVIKHQQPYQPQTG